MAHSLAKCSSDLNCVLFCNISNLPLAVWESWKIDSLYFYFVFILKGEQERKQVQLSSTYQVYYEDNFVGQVVLTLN